MYALATVGRPKQGHGGQVEVTEPRKNSLLPEECGFGGTCRLKQTGLGVQ